MTKKEQIQLCFDMIGTFCEAHKYDEELKKLLDKFLGNYLQNRRTPTKLEMELKLKRLEELSGNDPDTVKRIIIKTIESGWATFYPVSNNQQRSIDNIPKKDDSGNKPKRIVLTDETF
jgi:hypothetical protein